MGYISFLDLVGITRLACSCSEEYRKAIVSFELGLQEVHRCYPEVSIGVFSDSAYFETESLDSLLGAITCLRKELFFDAKYFTASITKGSLGDCIHNESNFSGMVIKNSEAINAYQLQNQLKGIGINIDSSIADSIKDKVVNSFYQRDIQTNEYFRFIDLKYQYKADVLFYILKNGIFHYTRIGCINKKAQRYYLSLIKSVMSSFDDRDLINNEDIIELLEELCIPMDCNVDIEIIIALILNRIMDAYQNISNNDENSIDSEEFIDNEIEKCFLYKLISKVHDIPEIFMSYSNKTIITKKYLEHTCPVFKIK